MTYFLGVQGNSLKNAGCHSPLQHMPGTCDEPCPAVSPGPCTQPSGHWLRKAPRLANDSGDVILGLGGNVCSQTFIPWPCDLALQLFLGASVTGLASGQLSLTL